MLTKVMIDRAPAKEKTYLMLDHDGLYLVVYPTRKKRWVLRSWQGGKPRQVTIGDWPDMDVAEARRMRDKLKSKARRDGDVSGVMTAVTLEQLFDRWIHEKKRPKVTAATIKIYKMYFSYLPDLHKVPLEDITRRMVLMAVKSMAVKRSPSTARRVAAMVAAVLDYGVSQLVLENNVARDLAKDLPEYSKAHFASARRPEDVGKLMRALEVVDSYIVRQALRFIAYTFVRSGEVRAAKWREIDWDTRVWHVPAEHTKMDRDHMVPLSHQAIAILSDLAIRTRKSEDTYIFPAPRGNEQMGRSTMITTLYGLPKKLPPEARPPQVTVHGFRATALRC